VNLLLPQSPIDKLDTPCLVRVLQQVSSQQQLVACAAVCSKWRTATREAISSIAVRECTQQKCDELQQWLVHPPAALYSLSLCLSDRQLQPGLRLQLSVLQHLRELKLGSVRLEVIAADGSVLQVADLLPRLQHCTKLHFVACKEGPLLTAAVAAFKDMPALQDLELGCHDLTQLNLAALPTTLTRLCLTDAPPINSTSAAGFRQLTGLRVLEATAFGIDTSKAGWHWWQVWQLFPTADSRNSSDKGLPCITPNATRLPVPVGGPKARASSVCLRGQPRGS